MMKIIAGAYTVLVFLMLSSCATSKRTSYFKTLAGDTLISGYLKPDYEPFISKGDNLGISINSLSHEENVKFNSLVLSGSNATGVPTYQVDDDGMIKMHRLGAVKAEGLTLRQLAARLQDSLKPYLREPLVNISFLNHKVTVIGAVSRPQVLPLTDKNLGVLDALAATGDILPDGRKDQVYVIRDSGENKMVKRLNLEDHSVFASEWYYLRPNDVVYVAADHARVEGEERRRRIQTTLSLVVSGVSLLIIILDRLLR